ncbi:hypothetical protein BURPSPAST_AC0058 [Burkholderia pseudomallei Pasteur 52237]|nr:hypothetical protein BURPSPAST_AC0058 [Burkholderia pseudomallei Pasteur 52237]
MRGAGGRVFPGFHRWIGCPGTRCIERPGRACCAAAPIASMDG